MNIPFFQIDAFAHRPFTGNPAAVCLLDGPRDPQWMQAVANEMNLSETAFVYPNESTYPIRWFTPTTEVNLCGHATLAAAHALWCAQNVSEREPISFSSRGGNLAARRKDDLIELDFPMDPVRPTQADHTWEKALGTNITFSGKTTFDLFAEVATEEEVRNLHPDIQLLSCLETRGIIVTSRSDSNEYDFISRFFAPRAGIDEDPVTGSAHCALGPYWQERLGQEQFTGYQASPRGGVVHVRVDGDRVYLSGQAVTIIQGHLVT